MGKNAPPPVQVHVPLTPTRQTTFLIPISIDDQGELPAEIQLHPVGWTRF